ncbi:MAG: hypothetical protein QM831_08155 [Kofleriaceae bacterium]
MARHPNEVVPPMPGPVKSALAKKKLLETFLERPDYQRREYLKGIEHAFGTPAKQKLIDQLVAEIENGKLYMGKPWEPPAPVEKK